MNLLKTITYLVTFSFLVASCSQDDEGIPLPLGAYEYGFLVTNEGPFQNGSGTVSFVSDDYLFVDNEIFNQVNSSDLGNIVQSMGFHGDQAYIVVNNSNKIEVYES